MNDLVIPYIFLQDKNLTLFDSTILAFIKQYSNDACQCFHSDNDIAKYFNISPASIPNTLSKLNKLGFIERHLEDNKRIITYTYDAPHRAAGKVGFIYIMKDTTNNFIKIGYSNNPKVRESTLQSEKPTIELIHKFRGSMQQEHQVHIILSKYRIRGEWFSCSISQAEEAIKRVIGIK